MTAKDTVEHLYKSLKRKYINPQATQAYALQFDSAQQQPSEALHDYFQRLERFVKLGFSHSKENDERMTRKLVTSLVDERLRSHLMEQGFYDPEGICKSHDKVLAAAQRQASIYKVAGVLPSTAVCGASGLSSFQSELHTLKQENAELRKKWKHCNLTNNGQAKEINFNATSFTRAVGENITSESETTHHGYL